MMTAPLAGITIAYKRGFFCLRQSPKRLGFWWADQTQETNARPCLPFTAPCGAFSGWVGSFPLQRSAVASDMGRCGRFLFCFQGAYINGAAIDSPGADGVGKGPEPFLIRGGLLKIPLFSLNIFLERLAKRAKNLRLRLQLRDLAKTEGSMFFLPLCY